MIRRFSFLVSLAAVAVITAVVAPTAFAQQRVLATTPWTAAFAGAAGAAQVELLAPYEMRHPPEYELRATDLPRIERADLVVFAGYETMMERLQRVIGERNLRAVRINTTHTRAVLQESIMAIAAALGTERQAQANLSEIYRFLDDWAAEVRQLELDKRPVLSHMHQAGLLSELGVNVVGTFGPAPLEAQQIARLSAGAPAVIVDNWHNEVAQPFRETVAGVRIASFINFPGNAGTRTLLDVLGHNRNALRQAVR